MSKRDWRNSIFAHGDGGSIFNADIYCDGCTEQLKKQLEREGQVPEDPDDESSYDSDFYPKVSDLTREESDSPQHCGSHESCVNAIKLPCGSKVGAWLGGALTGEGVESLADMIWNDLVSNSEHSRQVGRLWRHLYSDELSEYRGVPKETDKRGVQVSPRKGFHPIGYYVDLDSIYIVGDVSVSGDDSSLMEVHRYEASPTGTYPKNPEIVKSHTHDWEGRDPEEVLAEIIDNENWKW